MNITHTAETGITQDNRFAVAWAVLNEKQSTSQKGAEFMA